MCGIAGFINTDWSLAHLKKMTGSLAHRGPDAEGFYFNEQENIGLGHRRLSILDLSAAGNQPFYSKDGRYVMVFNGEIYNFRELAFRYKLHTTTTSDTEVIIELFSQHGINIVKELNGMFAMAIWDTNEKELFIFRDRFGVKPLFYYWDEKKLAFSSELKALRTDQKIQLEINHASFGYYFHLGFIPCPHTVYKRIYKLKPGEFLRLKEKKLSRANFVCLSDFVTEDVVSDEAAAEKKVEELLLKSVERQTISDVPLGVFLSGGTDSSLITALTKEISSEKVKTFSVGFQNSAFDELPYASKIADYLGTEHHEIHITDRQMVDNLFAISDAYDEPYIIASGFPTFSISEYTRKHVTVALSGEGSDEIFMGYGFHMWAERLDKSLIRRFGNLIGKGLQLSPKVIHRQKSGMFTDIDKYFTQSHIFSNEQFYFSIDEIGRHFSSESGFSELQKFGMGFPAKRKFNAVESQAWFDINLYLVDDLLTKIDRASMHYGLEARVPFLDNELFSYVINLDSHLKLHNGTGKYILKKILYKYIPREYFDRPKWGFSPPLTKWLRSDLKAIVDQYLEPSVVKRYGIVDPEYVSFLKKQYYNGQNSLCNRIWLLTLMHLWLERNSDL